MERKTVLPNPVYNELRYCLFCKKPFWVPKSHLKHLSLRGRGKYCSIYCRSRAKENKVLCVCIVCSKQFYTVPANVRRGRGKYCSLSCSAQGLSRHKTKEKIILHCRNCGKEIRVTPSHTKYYNIRHCSVKCRKEYTKKQRARICDYCGKLFYLACLYDAKRTGGRFCSRKCMHKGFQPTSIELLLYGALELIGLEYIPQYPLLNGKTIADAFLPEFNTALYADGDYWHSVRGRGVKDKDIDSMLSAQGIRVLRFKEKDIKTRLQESITLLTQALNIQKRISADDIHPLQRRVAQELIGKQRERLREHTCINCGKITLLPRSRAKRKYCSNECRKEFYFKTHAVNCPICGKLFLSQSHGKDRPFKQKYCSDACRVSAQIKTSICQYCGNTFRIPRRKYCSSACRRLARRGISLTNSQNSSSYPPLAQKRTSPDS